MVLKMKVLHNDIEAFLTEWFHEEPFCFSKGKRFF